MQYFTVVKDQYCHTTREHDPEDRWSGEETCTDTSVWGFEVTSEDKYWDGIAKFDLEYDKDYFLVYAIYSTGDSFSRHDGQFDVADLFETMDEAKEVKKILDGFDKNGEGQTVQISEGINYHVPWWGYFEYLEYVEIEVVRRMKQ